MGFPSDKVSHQSGQFCRASVGELMVLSGKTEPLCERDNRRVDSKITNVPYERRDGVDFPDPGN